MFVPTRRISIFDTTLHDGARSPGVALQPHERAKLALQIERLRADVIAAGRPVASAAELEGVRAVAAAVRRPVVAAAAGTAAHEIEAAGDALACARRSRIDVLVRAGTAESPEELAAVVGRAVGQAASRADEVQLSCEDALDCDPQLVASLARIAIRSGASVVSLQDARGLALPGQYAGFVEAVRSRCPELGDATLAVHCHDELGLAVACSLAGAQAGAAQVECTVNGIGERAGHAALEEVVVALKVRADLYGFDTGVDSAALAATSRLVSATTGCLVPANKAVVGANAFAHEAGIHQDGMLKDERTYQIIDPREVGVRMTLPLGKHSGRHAFARACAESGVELAGDMLDSAFRRFKALADTGRPVAFDDVFEEVTLA